MNYETFNATTEKQAYYQDLANQRELERIAKAEQARVQWAQSHGNDSGFDPYAGLED